MGIGQWALGNGLWAMSSSRRRRADDPGPVGQRVGIWRRDSGFALIAALLAIWILTAFGLLVFTVTTQDVRISSRMAGVIIVHHFLFSRSDSRPACRDERDCRAGGRPDRRDQDRPRTAFPERPAAAPT